MCEKLRLSFEHSGFIFQPEPEVAADMLKLHSGGKVSAALLMAMGRSIVHEKSTDRNKSAATTLSQHHDDLSLSIRSGRRSKREKDERSANISVPVDVVPKPVKKSLFCCFR